MVVIKQGHPKERIKHEIKSVNSSYRNLEIRFKVFFLLSIFLTLVLAKLHEHDKLAKVTEEIEKMKEAQVN